MKKSTLGNHHCTLTWLGHSAFKVVSASGRTLLIDPWLDNPKAPADAKSVRQVDLILITHGHADHVGNTVEIAQRTGAKVICIHEVSLYLQHSGVPTATGMNKGGTISVEGIKVTMVDAKHSADIDIGENVLPGGEAAGYVIELEDGFRLYHAGDTALFGDMKLIGQMYKPEVAILPIGDLYTMDPKAAAKACVMVNPKHIIGMHYGTFPPLTGTPEMLKKHLPERMRKRVHVLEPGKGLKL